MPSPEPKPEATPTTRPVAAPRRQPPSPVYFLLVLTNVVGIGFGIYAAHRLAGIQRSMADLEVEWTARMDRIGQLADLAAAVKAPGDNVFKSRSAGSEAPKLQAALTRFDERIETLRDEFRLHFPDASTEGVRNALEGASKSVDDLGAAIRQEFAAFDRRELDQATAQATLVEAQYVRAGSALRQLQTGLADLKRAQILARNSQAEGWRWAGYAAGGLSILLAAAVAVRGHRGARRLEWSFREQEKHVAELEESEERFRSLSAASPVGVFRTSTGGRLLDHNERWEEILGELHRGGMGDVWPSIVHPDDLPGFQTAWREMLREGRDMAHEFRLPLVSRNPRWISVLAGVVYDATETAVGCVGVLEEITARKRAEGALRSTAREFEDLYNHSLAGHLTFNRNGVITRVNDTQLRWLGYPRGDLVGAKRFSDLLTPASREVLAGQAEKFEQPGGLAGIELELVRSDGSTVPVLAGATVTRDTEGNVVATHCTLCEFSARKQFETELTRERDAALQSARHRSEFLAMVSHEIRTPMNGVIGMTGLLHDTRLTEEQEGYVQTIRSSADTLLTIINDILDFSRIEGGKLELTEEDFDLNDVLDTTLDLLAENARAKKLVLAGYIAAGTPGRLRGDAERLRQILTSLTGNAVKFTDTGEVVVRASSEMETDSHVRLRFEVRDTGVGISPATLEKLFQPFQQTEDLAMRRFGGAGLGLVISRQLVELMRGDLGAESEPGRGSTFWFTVHLEKQPPVFNAAQVPAAPTLQDRHILAVDDNPTGREVIRHQLQSTGSRLDLASSGKEALGMMRAAVERGDAYELAVLDWWMPEMDGLTLASQIKADLALSRTRLVLLTAMGENLAANLLHDRGIEACLHKPVKQTSLIKTLASVLEKKQPVFSAPVAVAGAAPVASRKIRILLAEDHLINQRVAMGLLAKLGYSAEAAANGIEVLEMLKQTAYDVILMDCQMPEMDGLEATRRIRAMEAKRAAGQVVNLASPRRTIIIAVTANAMQGDRERCLSAGMDDYLSKPVRLDTLEKMLQRAQVLAGDTSDAGPPAPPAAVAAPVPVRPAEEPPVAAVPQDDLMAALDQALVEMTPPPAKPAQSPAPDGDQPVDLDRIQELTDGNETGVQELVDLYLAQAAELTDKLRMAVESKSAEDIGHVAHKFCGASLTCGMVAVVASLRAMERLGKAGQVEGTPELMADVARQVDRIRLFWRNYFSGN